MKISNTDNAVPIQTLSVFHRAVTWVMGFARDLERGRRPEDGEGLILYNDEVDALRIPLYAILKRVALFETDGGKLAQNISYWRNAVRRYVVVDDFDIARHRRIGEHPPCGAIHHIEFQARPNCLPFTDIMFSMARLARAGNIPLQDILFQYRGTVVRDGTTMLNIAQNHADEYPRIADALHRWHDRTTKLFTTETAKSTPPCHIDCGVPVPDELRGRLLPRSDIARQLRRSSRTLSRWDRDGRASFDLPWISGKRRGNVVLYDIEKNWPTIVNLLRRGGNPEKIRAIVAEFAPAAAAWQNCQDSVLDELIAREESAMPAHGAPYA